MGLKLMSAAAIFLSLACVRNANAEGGGKRRVGIAWPDVRRAQSRLNSVCANAD